MNVDVLVVGAGPAGLAVAASLQRRGITPVVVDRGSAVGDSWRARYDRLHLHTPRVQSGLPGLRIPRSAGRWVSRDDYAAYLADYARHHGIVPRFGTEVRRLDRQADGWRATTADGVLDARQVVLASGYNGPPVLPAWPGADSFGGEVLHTSAYRSPAPFRDRAVLVVGAGNTGTEIAVDLAEGGARSVHLAVRTPPNVIPRTLGPLPTTLLGISLDPFPARLTDPLNRLMQRVFVGDLTRYGFPAPRQGLVAQVRATGKSPTIDVGFIAALRAGAVTPVPALVRFDGDEAVLADGSRLRPDVVLAATGYRTGLEPLVGHLGVLDEAGRPRVHGGRTDPAAPGLRFVGLANPVKGLLFAIRLDARSAAAAIGRELARERPPALSST